MKIINSDLYKLLNFYNESYTRDKEHYCSFCLRDLIAPGWNNCTKSKNILEKKHCAINLFMRSKDVINITVNWRFSTKYYELHFIGKKKVDIYAI